MTDAWSSARAHVLGEADPLLAPGRPYPGPVEDWADWLRDPMEEEAVGHLRQSTQSGRPCGSVGFVTMLETRLGRRLRPQRRGPKKKDPGKVEQQDESGQLDILG